jgi:hypothetical protein
MKFNWFGLLLNLIVGFVIYGGILLLFGSGILTYVILTICISCNILMLIVTTLQDKGYLYKEKDYGYRQEQREITDEDVMMIKIGEWVNK